MNENVVYSYLENNYEIAYRTDAHTTLIPPHTHNAVEFYVTLADIPSVLLGSQVLPVPRNSLIIFPEYCVHYIAFLKDVKYKRYVLTVNTLLFDKIFNGDYEQFSYLKDSMHPLLIPLSADVLTSLTGSLDNLLSVQKKHPLLQMPPLFTALCGIHDIVIRFQQSMQLPAAPELSVPNKTVNDMISYINSHLCENLRVQNIAAVFYLSPDYAAKIFKAHMGTTIHNFITIQRMAIARRLLSEGLSVSEVQEALGYTSYSYFFRTFKKTVGKTPREYADSLSQSGKR